MEQYLSQYRIEGPLSLESSKIVLLRSKLSELEAQFEDLEIQLSHFKPYTVPFSQLLVQFKGKSTSLVEIILLRNVLSPIRRVPVEILSKIFEIFCLAEQDGLEGALHDILVRYVPIIVRVCVTWRNAALANSRIWSKFCLSAIKHPKVFKFEFSWVTEWLNRSQRSPLDIHLDFRVGEEEESYPWGTRSLLGNLLRFSPQFRSLSIAGDPSLFLPVYALLPEHDDTNEHGHSRLVPSLPLLESVSLNTDGYPLPFVARAFQGAPRLRWVEIIEPPYCSMLTQVKLPLGQLTHIEISRPCIITIEEVGTQTLASGDVAAPSNMSVWNFPLAQQFTDDYVPDNYDHILRQCDHLVSLTFPSLPPHSFGFNGTMPIFLPMLRSLDITCCRFEGTPHTGSKLGDYHGVNLLRCLAVPHLQSLTLRLAEQNLDDLSVSVNELQALSATRLSSLTLVGFWGGCRNAESSNREEIKRVVETVLDMFTVFSTITTLRILEIGGGHSDINPLFKSMVYTKDQPAVFLPNLIDLQIEWEYGYDNNGCYPPDLNTLILSRSWADELELGPESGSRRDRSELSDDGAGDSREVVRLQNLTVRGSTRFEKDIAVISQLPGLRVDYMGW